MKDSHLKRIVRGVFIYWISFILITWITFWVKGCIPDTLVQVGLGGGVFELICTTIIEIAKKKYDNTDDRISVIENEVNDIRSKLESSQE
nr:MAG TPA: Prefoldin subunit [Caudoviricetes sp.]